MSKKVSIEIDGASLKVQAGITVQKVMELSGYKITKYPEDDSLFTPCETGGCWEAAGVARLKSMQSQSPLVVQQ